ncbi:PAS domain S-box protein [Syntrophobacter fumaroxidans]|uniref:histidine kinase n=1 Tax=Syntrophobacter fumaroxidans (strain DSM 10017 / MPOB) TaxID=335543 RepID=A0LEY0_SYNFM|nr:PAS domain S-box protein [Syntrophobacter fumaroxidans]ABK15982.1 PAS/PAC sensor signal transduction histidine kinase [Syntrophobacter fumaroxidans MPOB]
MQDEEKSREQLIRELEEMRRRLGRQDKELAELKGMEEALRESAGRYRQMAENIREVFWMADLQESRMLYISPAYEGVWGRTCDSLYANPTSWMEGIHPADRERVDELLAQRASGGYSVEYRVVRPDGSVRWVLDRGFPISDAAGTPYRIAGIAEDITDRKNVEAELHEYRDRLEDLVKERTADLARANEQLTHEIEERKKAEQKLRESQQMLQSVLDTIPVRVFWKDFDSNYLGCNGPFARDAGLQSPEEIVGKNDLVMIWADLAELYRADDRMVMETGRPKLGYEEPQTTPSGGRVWLRTNKVPLLDSEGRIKGVLGTYEDITESKRIEEMLRVSETKYRIVADNTHDWEYWMSPEGRFLYISPSCERITGYPAGAFEADPRLLSRIVHPDDVNRFNAHVAMDRTAHTRHGLEFRIINRDGATRWIGHLCQPVFDEKDCFMGRRGSNRDITDRKLAEEALQDSAEKLKLFAYSVAHDLKSPAIGIYGLTKRLNRNYRSLLDEKGKVCCDQILRTSEHIAALVDKINVYIATKEAPLAIEEINIAEIIRMLRDEFSAQLSLRRIDWLEPEARIEIRADRVAMLRAFRNFVDNSLKYGGEKLSTIQTGYEESEDFHIFSFSDNGKGLKEGDAERIFGAFQRNPASKGVEGAGLGLAIVKEIAAQHSGRVWVEPRAKRGITFCMSISKNL